MSAVQTDIQAAQHDAEEIQAALAAAYDRIRTLERQLQARDEQLARLEQQLTTLRAPLPQKQRQDINEPGHRPPASPPGATGQPASPPSEPANPISGLVRLTRSVNLVHLEENPAFREAMCAMIRQVPGAHYLDTLEHDGLSSPDGCLLAINLLHRTHDPLAVITASVSADRQTVFAYCAEESHGFQFGVVDFFSRPIEPDACVSRLFESRGAIQRLLVVSEDLDLTGALREVLSRMHCSTSVALDMRQVMDLLPLIEPNVLLVDLGLPRGEGFRLVSRLRSDGKTRELPLGIILPGEMNSTEFRQQALRAAREQPLSPVTLAQALGRLLGASVQQTTPLRTA